jgi:hypothetical protein
MFIIQQVLLSVFSVRGMREMRHIPCLGRENITSWEKNMCVCVCVCVCAFVYVCDSVFRYTDQGTGLHVTDDKIISSKGDWTLL